MGRIKRSWYLGTLSWRVLRGDRTLAVFPVVTAIAAFLVFLAFTVLIGLTGIDDTGNDVSLAPLGWVLTVAMYFASGIVVTFFQAALVCGANDRLDGRDTTVGAAIATAGRQFPAIAAWALLQTTVTLVLKALEERAGIIGDIIAGLFGLAWGIVTFLAIPVVALEGQGPFRSLKRSGALLQRTWGENLAGQFGFGILGFFASLPAVLLFVIAVTSGSWAVGLPLGAVAVLWVLAVSVVISAMTGIYKTALYRYAVDGRAPAGFATSDLADAFAPRSR